MVRNNNYHRDNKKPYRTFTRAAKDIQQLEEQTSDDSAFFDSFPKDIKSIITKLRITIDHIDSPRNYARDLIHELARQLDERRLCERGRISIKIKEILEDKIHAGKVTERWIRKCLPPEYKREYAKDKRELSSLLEKKPITVTNNGQQTISNEHDTQKLKEPDDTPAESVNSSQLSNPTKLQRSDWKTGTESLPPEQATTEQSADTDTTASEPRSMAASPTLPESIDIHVAEDSVTSRSMDKSACQNCSDGNIGIKKLEDENRELHIRCQRAESNNTELVLQLTRQSKYINENLNPDKDQRSQPSSTTDVNLLSHPSDKYIGQECTSCLELQDEVTQLREALQRISISTADQIQASGFEFLITKEKYEMVKDAMDKSESAILVKYDGSKKFVRAVADVDN